MRIVALACLFAVGAFPSPGPSIVFLFGSCGAVHARDAARSAAGVCRRWLKEPGATAEIRKSGAVGGIAVSAGTPAKNIESVFELTAKESRDADANSFLNSLDSAAQALAGRSGFRLLVTVVENPSFSTEGEAQLQQIIDFCKEHTVRVVVLDPSEMPSRRGTERLGVLGSRTGGALIHEPGHLRANVLVASAGEKLGESAFTPAERSPEAERPLPAATSDLPVYTRFVRISPRGSQSAGTQRSVGAGRGGITTVEGGPNLEDSTGPMRGFFLVQSPLGSLHFDTDSPSGVYSARARVTQIARNSAGKIVWRASKQVNLRGPAHKMAARQSGNLYYLREVVLPAGQYTLEAAVEDLIAGKTGRVREPLRTGMGTPSFTVSDALVVRPFDPAADKFEADQVLNYDGNAISPLLAPTYEANQPFDLRLYLVVYPNIYGEQPQMSLEILRNGHVVGRSSLPFTDKIRSDVTETSGVSSMVGEQKHEFPYMATLRGMRLGPGDYEARMTVRQGRNALTRSATFKVTGITSGDLVASAGPSAARVADEDAQITLPEVDPAPIAEGERIVPAAEQKRIWDEATSTALSYSARLPNFRCNRETRRLISAVRSPDQLREADAFIEELTYEDGKESYRTIEVNGQKSSMQRSELKGVYSRGEFGSMLRSIFRPEVGARYRWSGRAMNGGVLCDVFDVDIPVAKSSFVLTFNLRQEVSGFHGRVFADGETGLVRRMTLQGTGLPKDFGLQSPTFSLEYGLVRVGDNDYLLPLRSVLQVRQGKKIVRNETRFRDYRKFEASSEIKF